jgi:hypothetical protein
MKRTNEQVQIQRETIYFPADLLTQLRESAKKHKRSLNKETLWLVEQGLHQQSSTSAVGAQR